MWNIVLTLNGLDYVLRGDDLVVVGTPESLARLRPALTPQPAGEVQIYPVQSNPTEIQALLQSQFGGRERVTITAFDTLGLVSVRGTAAQQARVADILARFDRRPAVPVRRAYTLSYAEAEVLAEVLRETVTLPEEGEQSAQTPPTQGATTPAGATTPPQEAAPESAAGAASFVASGDLTIAADPRTNRLIVTAPVELQEEIAELIAELDQPEQQVNIQVRIQEVTADTAGRLGVDLTAGVGNFSATLFGGDDTSGLNFVFDAQRAVTGFNLGATLDAFERQGLSRRVDDSNLTVLNNGTATLQSGGTIFISIPGAEQNIERTIPYGVQLNLTPQITNSDDVILDVGARVETILSETENPNFLNLSTRNLTSRVTLAPGQTVVLGGLFQNELRSTVRSVPGLSSVPIIGGLFTNRSSQGVNTELLVIVTTSVLE